MPVYLARHLWKVVSLKPPLRRNPLTGRPASARLMQPMIRSAVHLLFLVSVVLQVDGLHFHYAGTAWRGRSRNQAATGDLESRLVCSSCEFSAWVTKLEPSSLAP